MDRIEVLRGPGSVIYGSDAVSGVVQIFTRRGDSRVWRSRVGGRPVPSAPSTATLQSWAVPPRFTYSADASRLSTDGIYHFNNEYGNTALSASVRGLPDERTDASSHRPLHRQPISLPD